MQQDLIWPNSQHDRPCLEVHQTFVIYSNKWDKDYFFAKASLSTPSHFKEGSYATNDNYQDFLERKQDAVGSTLSIDNLRQENLFRGTSLNLPVESEPNLSRIHTTLIRCVLQEHRQSTNHCW